MTSVAIMQPTWLPWLGYLDLMDRVDVFILLDDVEFSYQSWQHRNKIRTADGLSWFTLPVAKRDRSKPINEVRLGGQPNAGQRLANQLREAYRRSRQHDVTSQFLDLVRSVEPGMPLIDPLRGGIGRLREEFGIFTPMPSSVEFTASDQRGQRLVDLVRAVEGDLYVTPAGATGYLKDDASLFERAGVEIVVHTYEHPEYRQLHEPFLPFASSLDLLLSAAQDQARDIFRSGRRPARAFAQEDLSP